jgi:hypothetical protein
LRWNATSAMGAAKISYLMVPVMLASLTDMHLALLPWVPLICSAGSRPRQHHRPRQADRSVTVKHSNGRLSSRVCRAYLPCHYRSLRPGKSVSRRAPAAAAAPLATAAVPVAAATAEVTGAAAAAAAVGTGLVDEMEQ